MFIRALISVSQSYDEEHNVRNPVLGFCCHYFIDQHIEEVLTEGELGRLPLRAGSFLR